MSGRGHSSRLGLLGTRRRRRQAPSSPGEPGRASVIVIGPTPPPAHGVSVFTVSLLQSLSRLGSLEAHLDTRDPRSVWNVGRLDPTNVRLAIEHTARLIGLLVKHRRAAVYVPISQGPLAFLRDAVFIWLARMARRPVILHLHGGGFGRFYEDSSRALRFVIRHTVRGASQAWVLAPGLRSCFDGLIEASQVHVLPNVVEAPTAALTLPDDDRGGDHPPSTGLRMLFLGNILAIKGCFVALDALALLGSRAAGWHLRFVGDVEDDVRGRLLDRGRGLDEVRVELVGVRLDADKAAELGWADVLVAPTFHPQEGQPLVILEALSAGVPVVSTRHAAIPETVRHGVEAILVPPEDPAALADALLELASDPARLRAMSTAARARYEQSYRPTRLDSDLVRLLTSLG